MSEKNDDVRHVVVSRKTADDSDYVAAVVHPSEESANEYRAEREAAAPWHSHTVVTENLFLAGPVADSDID